MNEQKDLQVLEKLTEARTKFLSEISKSIIGQVSVLDHVLIALFCKGHTLLVGVPGLAKTLMKGEKSSVKKLNKRTNCSNTLSASIALN